jgi:hypothetical protein
MASVPLEILFHDECGVSTSLGVIAKSNTRSGTTCGGGLMRCGTTLISGCSSSSTLVYRNLGNFVLCVNLTTNSGELNSWKETGVTPQLFSSSLMC